MKITNFYKRIMIYKETYLPLTQALGILNQKINKPYVSSSRFFTSVKCRTSSDDAFTVNHL